MLNDDAKAFYCRDVEAAGIVNDFGDIPVMIWAGDNNFQAYIRQLGDQVLTFRLDGDRLVDEETGSTWNITRGLASEGDLWGEGLQALPGLSAFDWAWLDFYPDSAFYKP